MLILAGVTISLVTGDSGVLNQAEVAVEKQNYATAQERIKAQCQYITEGKNAGKVNLAETEANIRNSNFEEVKEIIPGINLLTIELNDGSKIEIPGVNGNAQLNEYGFYYDVDYVCYDYFGNNYTTDVAKARLLKDGTYVANTYQDRDFKKGDSISFSDFTGKYIFDVDSLEINKEYTKKGTLDCDCTWKVDENGDIIGNIVLDKEKIIYSYKTVNFGGILNCIASEDGKSFNVNGKIFKIEE